MGDGWGWWMMIGGVWMVVCWGLILYGISALTTRGRIGAPAQMPAEPTALETLGRRYARGDLGDAEFEAMRERLTRSNEIRPSANGTTVPPTMRT